MNIRSFSKREMNPKNKLQELTQKHKTNLPVYETLYSSHGFFSSVTAFNHTIKSTLYFPSKIKAEMNVAGEFLKYFQATIPVSTSSDDLNYIIGKSPTFHLFIDAENVMDVVTKGEEIRWWGLENVGVLIDIFMSRKCPLAKENLPSYHITKSIHRDAADIHMILFIGEYLKKHRNEIYILVSKDHFAVTLADVLSEDNITVKVCISLNEIRDVIKSYL